MHYMDRLHIDHQRPKSKHLQNFRDSGYFSYCREIVFENIEPCDAERFIGIALSQGQIQNLLKNSITEIEPYIEVYKRIVTADILNSVPMSVGYRMIAGIRS